MITRIYVEGEESDYLSLSIVSLKDAVAEAACRLVPSKILEDGITMETVSEDGMKRSFEVVEVKEYQVKEVSPA